jgi:methylmalonyl-CoA epimerase
MAGIDTKRINCVALAVRDLDEKVRVWTELLGVEPVRVLTSPPPEEAGTEYKGESTAARLRVAVFKVGDSSLELLEPIGGPSVWSEFLELHGEGLHHVGFIADDLEEGIETLAAEGCEVVQRASYDHGFGKGRYAYFASESQFGAMIELNELK